MGKKKTFNSLKGALTAPEDVRLLRISDQDDFDQYSSELGRFPNITELQLYDLVLTSLPAELGQLSTLKKIEMIHTQFQSLPLEIGQLDNLRTLYIFSNKETFQLPPEIGQLRNLKTLRIEYCGLYELPDEVGALNEINFYGKEVRSHYIQDDKRPFYCIGDNDHQYFYFVPLESSDWSDSWVYLVDHEGEEYRPSKMPLSKLLSGLKTVEKKQPSGV